MYKRALALFIVMVLSACSSHPNIVGTWHREGTQTQDVGPNWTDLTFTNDKVVLTFIPSGLFSAYMSPEAQKEAAKPRHETAPYETLGNGEIRITQNGDAQIFKTEIKNDRLYISPVEPATGDANADKMIAAEAAAHAMVFDRVK